VRTRAAWLPWRTAGGPGRTALWPPRLRPPPGGGRRALGLDALSSTMNNDKRII
jgi:hypothetical protein